MFKGNGRNPDIVLRNGFARLVQLRVDPPVMMGGLLVRNQHGANAQEFLGLSQRFGLETHEIGTIEQFAQYDRGNVKSRFLESSGEGASSRKWATTTVVSKRTPSFIYALATLVDDTLQLVGFSRCQ
jgi:hypothetical protein